MLHITTTDSLRNNASNKNNLLKKINLSRGELTAGIYFISWGRVADQITYKNKPYASNLQSSRAHNGAENMRSQ